MDHHSRLGRQQAEELGLETVAAPPQPLHPPPQNVVGLHHRSGPIEGGLNIISAEEHAVMRAPMTRVFMPGETPPSLLGINLDGLGVSMLPSPLMGERVSGRKPR